MTSLNEIVRTYCQLLAAELSPEDLSLVQRGLAYPDDFCDGNLLLEEALTKNGVAVWDDADEHMLDSVIDLWNAAYDAAAAKNFIA